MPHTVLLVKTNVVTCTYKSYYIISVSMNENISSTQPGETIKFLSLDYYMKTNDHINHDIKSLLLNRVWLQKGA